MTLGKIIVNLSNREFATGLTYTAVSRVKRLADIAFKPFPNYVRISNIFSTPSFKERLQEESRKAKLASDHEEWSDILQNIDMCKGTVNS